MQLELIMSSQYTFAFVFLQKICTKNIELAARPLEELYDFISTQLFCKQSLVRKEDMMLSLLGSFSLSVDQALHWDYKPTGIGIPHIAYFKLLLLIHSYETTTNN